jgi:hypothetical protein
MKAELKVLALLSVSDVRDTPLATERPKRAGFGKQFLNLQHSVDSTHRLQECCSVAA